MIIQSQKPFTLRSGAVFGGGRLLICVPLISATEQSLIQDAKLSCAAAPDMIEWRVDYYNDYNSVEKLLAAAKAVRREIGSIPLLFTPRDPAEGGAAPLDEETKLSAIRALCGSGAIDLVDTELRQDDAFLQQVRSVTAENGVKLVLSYHDFKGMPTLEEAEEKLRRAESLGADVNKLALMPHDYHEVAEFSAFLCGAKQTWMKNPVVASLMGDVGAVSRFAGGSLGSDMSFAAVTGISGPGQMHITDCRQLNRLIEG